MPAFYLFDVQGVTDPQAMETYRERVAATVTAHGGRYRVLGGPVEVVEGHWKPVFPVLLEFPTIEAAKAWYESDAYRPLRDIRLHATRGTGVLLVGV